MTMLTTYYTVIMDRDDGGKFTCKGDSPRKVRSFRLTDETYDAISEAAENLDLSKGDYLEKLNEDGVFSDEDKDSDSDINDTLNHVLHGLLEDLYDENSLEVSSKDKAAVKRYLQNLIDNLDDVVSNYC